MTKDTKRSYRATFMDTKSAQQKLTEWLDNLVKENKPLDPEDRPKFERLLANAMLGQDTEISISNQPAFATFNKYDWEIDGIDSRVNPRTAGDLARYAKYVDSSTLRTEDGKEVPIKTVWATVRALCHRVYPLALQVAIRMSREIVGKRGTEYPAYGARTKGD